MWVLVVGVVLGVVVQVASPSWSAGPQARELHRLRAVVAWQRHERRSLEHRLREKWELATPTLRDAAFIAARVYPSVDPWALLRVSACETSGSFNPRARVNHARNASSATGPMQFLDSTWRATPFAQWSPANAYVAMLAAAQIVAHDGSFAKWDCRWAA